MSYDDDTIELMLVGQPLQQSYWMALAVPSQYRVSGLIFKHVVAGGSLPSIAM